MGSGRLDEPKLSRNPFSHLGEGVSMAVKRIYLFNELPVKDRKSKQT
jgi:hypothetical protein